jgi:uncharacterized protein
MLRKLFIIVLFGLAVNAFAELALPPKPTNYVNDYANVLSQRELTTLNQRLAAYDKKTSTQIFIAIFPSLDGGNLEDTSIQLAEKWGVGTKAHDNGVLFSVFLSDRKMRIEVGYGLEDRLTDAVSGSIIRNNVRPYFQKKHYAAGLNAGINAMIQATQGDYSVLTNTLHNKRLQSDFTFMALILMTLVIVFVRYVGPLVCVLFAVWFFGWVTGMTYFLLLMVSLNLLDFIKMRTCKTFYSRDAGNLVNFNSIRGAKRSLTKHCGKPWRGYYGGPFFIQTLSSKGGLKDWFAVDLMVWMFENAVMMALIIFMNGGASGSSRGSGFRGGGGGGFGGGGASGQW